MYEIPTTMGKMKNMPPIFAVDFEGSAKIGVVEYGVAEIRGGEIVCAHTRICAPKAKISARDSGFFQRNGKFPKAVFSRLAAIL